MAEDIRQLVRVVDIDDIKPIEGADKIEVAKVGGWNVVVQKGLYTPGDQALFFEVDSCLPLEDTRFAHLAERGTKLFDGKLYHRLKTIRLRGVYSQGMLMPIHEFISEIVTNGDELALVLGVLKYDDLLPALGVGGGSHPGLGYFPTQYVPKTDAERVQNLAKNWEEIQQHTWIPTLKVDGSSMTVTRAETGDFIVSSRNWQVSPEAGVYGEMFQKYREVFDWLVSGESVQMEVVGPGIQGNPMGLTERRVYVFNLYMNNQYIPRDAWSRELRELAVPVLDLRLPATIEEALAQVDGLKYDGRLAEGVVWINSNYQPFNFLGGRHVWKAINNKYLLKHS